MTSADIADKAAFVRQALDDLAAIPQATRDAFVADRRNLPAALHSLQTAIQGLLDIGLILIATRGLRTPRSSSEVIERLEEAELLPAGSAAKYRPVVGFRNRVVHLYDRIDPDIVYRIVTEDRADLIALLALLLDAARD